jgi:hypothetical protein
MTKHTGDLLLCVTVALILLVEGIILGSTRANQIEDREWIAGRRRVEAGQIQVWHAPLKPGDTGWWEKR